MTIIILNIDLNTNSPEYNRDLSSSLQRRRIELDAQAIASSAQLDDYLSNGYTVIFNCHVVYRLKKVETDRAMFILYKPE